MFLFCSCWRRAVQGALIALLLAGCGRELSRTVAPARERQGAESSRGAAAGRAAAHRPAASNQPPLAITLSPTPPSRFRPNLAFPVTLEWTGQDAEGQLREYRYHLFGTTNPDFPVIPDFIAHLQAHPQAVRDRYAPDFEGWERLRVRRGPENRTATPSSLVPNATPAFAVVAIDQRGDHDRDLSLDRNVLVFAATFPRLVDITLRGSFGEATNPTNALTVPAGVPVTIYWSATPRQPGVRITGYRSSVDDFPPVGEPSPADTTEDFPPSAPGAVRLLHLEVLLDPGRSALGVFAIRFTDTLLAANDLR